MPRRAPSRARGDNPGRASLLTDAFATLRLLLAAKPLTAGELADSLDRPRRSAERLVHALEEAGLEVERISEGRHVRLRARRQDVLRALGLSQ